jgi:hypothetical protein
MKTFKQFINEKTDPQIIKKEIIRASKGKNTKEQGGDFEFDSLIDAQYDGKELISGTYIESYKDGWKVYSFDREGDTFESSGSYKQIMKTLKTYMLDYTAKRFEELVKDLE